MVEYESDDLFPHPIERVWSLVQDHLADDRVSKIHPLIRQQRTLSQDGGSTLVERRIDARGKILTSQWRLTVQPPERFRWEIVTSEGPYAVGGWMENTYRGEAGGTRVHSRGDLKITVLPFFLPQRPVLRRVLDTIGTEDQQYLRP